MRFSVSRLRTALRDHGGFIAVYAVFAAVLLYQHGLGWNWDFLVYTMNGRYLFHGGFFMEWVRPPVAPVLLGLLQFVLPRAAGYGFIAVSAAVAAYAVHRFAAAAGVDRVVLSALLLTPGVIAFSTAAGTELLSLAILLLFLADRRPRAGAWLGLAALTRYVYILFLPLVLFRERGTRVRTLTAAGLVAVPWAAYTYAATGDPLTGPVSFLALNVVLRDRAAAASLPHVALMVLPTALVLAAAVKREVREGLRARLSTDPLARPMLYIAAATVAIFLVSGVQKARFLYPAVLPLAYAGSRILDHLDAGRTAVYGLLAVNMVVGGMLATTTGHESPAAYRDAAVVVDGCMVESGQWVPLAYAGVHATHPVDGRTTRQRLERGWRVVDFTGDAPPGAAAPGVTVLADGGAYRVYGRPDRCAPPRPVNRTRIDEFNAAQGTDYTATGFLLDLPRVHRLDGDRP